MAANQTPLLKRLHVLILEDNRMDRAVIRETLREGGLECEFCYVETQSEFETALGPREFDLIFGQP